MFKVNDILKLKYPEDPFRKELRFQVYSVAEDHIFVEVIDDVKSTYMLTQEEAAQKLEKTEYLIG